MHALTDRDREVLDFERDWRRHLAGKGAAIRQRFGVSPQRYYQILARLAGSDAAFAYDPLTVARVRRRRERRGARRTARVHQQGSR